jgi:hypothetical protein
MEEKKSTFAVLNPINCNDKTEKKNGLTYLSWAWAWGIAKTYFPDANYTIYENADGWNYHTDGRTCWVKTGVTIGGQEHIEYLPVMDTRNRSIPFEQVTSFDVNKAIQRSLTKALARHGLGLYIYAGEDLPDAADDEARAEAKPAPKKAARKPLTDDQYWTIVANEGKGLVTKLGWPYRTAWIENYKPSEEEIAKFDHDVDLWRAANQPQK